MKKEKIYNYFYIINNLINGHFYLGVHSTNKLADGYMGSGDAIKAAIKNYGKENFELTPLKFFKTRKELMAFEKEIVNDTFLQYYRGICYNLKKGGEGGSEKRFTDEEMKNHERERHLKWKEQNPEKKKEMNRKWDEQNPEKKKEMRHKYNQSPAGKEAHRKYNQSPKGKEMRCRVNQSPAGKEAHRKYDQSSKGKEAHRKWYEKKKAEKLASQQGIII